MPDQEIAFLTQFAVLWPKAGYDAYGQPAVGDAVQIPVRWNTERREVLQPNGNTIAFDASAVVRQKIAIGSHMWLGELVDWYGTGSGSGSVDTADDEVMVVKNYTETKDLKGRAVFREVMLMRLHNKPGSAPVGD